MTIEWCVRCGEKILSQVEYKTLIDEKGEFDLFNRGDRKFGKRCYRGYGHHCTNKPMNALELRQRLRVFETAAEYDRERTKPASDEARDIWARILDKPHWALPTIQALIDERDKYKAGKS